MRAAGLPEGYAAALSTGLWPSIDVLPPAELARRGTPLAPVAFDKPDEDWVACATNSGHLLVFPVAEMPRMACMDTGRPTIFSW